MHRSIVPAAILALGAVAGAAEEEIAGLGTRDCAELAGAENAPVLAAAVDWGLGYLAGRTDAGHEHVAGEPLSTTDAADLAVGIVLYCKENPYGVVLDALRAYGLRVFGEGPADDPGRQPNHPRTPPAPRPPLGPSAAVAALIEAGRIDAEAARLETAAAAAALSRTVGPSGLAARMAVGAPPEEPVVSRAASTLGAGLLTPSQRAERLSEIAAERVAAPATSPRPPRRAEPGLRRTGPL